MTTRAPHPSDLDAYRKRRYPDPDRSHLEGLIVVLDDDWVVTLRPAEDDAA